MPHTAFLARLIGLFSMIVAVSLALHKHTTMETVATMLQNAPLLLTVGFISLAAGLAVVLSHNVWRSGLLALIVTLAGWVFLLRGVAILALPHRDMIALLGAAHYEQFFYGYTALAFIVGAYMTIAGIRRA